MGKMKITKYKQTLETQKQELISIQMALATYKDELWKYHPDNPESINIKEEYSNLIIDMENNDSELDKIQKSLNSLN